MEPTTLDAFVKLWQLVAVPLIGWWGYLLRDMRNQLRQLNGRVSRTEQWTQDHERADGLAHDFLRDHVSRIDAELRRRAEG